MKITKINWLSESAKEAELIISDGKHQCLVFSQPCEVLLNQTYTTPLHAFDVEDLMIVTDKNINEEITKTDEYYFSQHCIARVENIEESIVKVGEILIQLDIPIPSWAREGDLVEFKCDRLDIW